MQTQAQAAHHPDIPAGIPAPDVETPIHWNLPLKIAFRFAFSYFGLYCFPFPLGALPYTDKPAEWYELLWQKVVPWVAQHWLHLAQPITTFTNGSGDTVYDYIKALCFLIIASVTTLVWSLWDRKRENYARLHHWLALYLRLALGATMLSYGAAKVVKSQFPDVSLARLLQPYGDSSPMGLLWTFMGASKTYNVFTGAVEMLGGALLFIPRLTTLGALVCICAMGNVFILNMSYDVPVKLYSFHLLVMSVVLAAPDLRRLANLFIFRGKVQLAVNPPLFRRKWANRGLLAAQLLLGVYFAGTFLYGAHQSSALYNAKSPLQGIWVVDEFSMNGQVRPVSLTDQVRWNRVIFDNAYELSVQSIDGARNRYRSRIDLKQGKITFVKRDNPTHTADFTFSRPQPELLTLEGAMEGQRIGVKLHRIQEPSFLLNTRGFHWINEYPYNH
jgi:uncharacterized membrane protein YphA (DoxX/SURF4 family)